MTDIQKELLAAIEEVAMNTGITTKECIKQAIEILKEEEKDENMGND